MGFTVNQVTVLGGLTLPNAYYTFRKQCTNDARVIIRAATVQQTGTDQLPLHQRLPLCAADHFHARLATTFALVITEGDGSQTTVWFNPDGREAPPYTTARVIMVSVSDPQLSASEVASAVVAAVADTDHVSVQSGSWVQWLNTLPGDVPVADLSALPDYTRYTIEGRWSAFVSKAAYQLGSAPVDGARFTVEGPRWLNYNDLYVRFQSDARFNGMELTADVTEET